MPHYGRQGPQPLSSTDWEKVETLEWPWHWRKFVPEVLKKVRDNGSVPDNEVNIQEFPAYAMRDVINQGFRKADLPYRLFKATYGGDTYAVGIVRPVKWRSKKLKKATLRARAISDVIKAARVVARRSTPKNTAQLRKVLRNPNLPT